MSIIWDLNIIVDVTPFPLCHSLIIALSDNVDVDPFSLWHSLIITLSDNVFLTLNPTLLH